LQGMAAVVIYSAESWTGSSAQPSHHAVLTADRLPGDKACQIRQALHYFDGHGREWQHLQRATPGEAYLITAEGKFPLVEDEPMVKPVPERWRVLGSNERDAAGRTIRCYPGYFINRGRSVRMRPLLSYEQISYDSLGQQTFVRQANGNYRLSRHYPWYGVSLDENDSYLTRSPPGAARTTVTRPTIGMHGEHIDWIGELTQLYNLGSGVRAYDPTIQRFLSMDPYSPFSVGGINPYGFCNGDPVNHSDPSGYAVIDQLLFGLALFMCLSSLLTFGLLAAGMLGMFAPVALGIAALSATSGVTGVASYGLQDSDPEASRILGYVSIATGLAVLVAGMLGNVTLALIARTGRIVEGVISGKRHYLNIAATKFPMKNANLFLYSERFREGSLLMAHSNSAGLLMNPWGRYVTPHVFARQVAHLPAYVNSSKIGPVYLMTCSNSYRGFKSSTADMSFMRGRKVITFNSRRTLYAIAPQEVSLDTTRNTFYSAAIKQASPRYTIPDLAQGEPAMVRFCASDFSKPLHFSHGRLT
ncbi:MAG: RHS repeat-associated core domain-containing protein, partial [Microvirgula sp.]